MSRTTAAVAAFALLVGACSSIETVDDPSPTIPVPGSVSTPGVFASAMVRFESCDALLDHYISEAVDMVGPYGFSWHGPIVMMAEDAVRAEAAAPAGEAGAAQGPAYTGTNNQVTGVDEADLMKTDGRHIYTVIEGKLRISRVADGGAPLVSVLELDWWPQAMLLHGDVVLLLGGGSGSGPIPLERSASVAPVGWTSATVRIAQVDVSDRDRPTVVYDLVADGSYVGARLVDGVARVAVNSGPVGFEWVTPQGSGIRAEREATEANRQIIRESTLDNWLPYFVLQGADGTESEGRLLDCRTVMAPETFAGIETLSLLTFDLERGIDSWAGAGVVGSGITMYATAQHTYLATQPWVDWAVLSESELREESRRGRSQIHLFDTTLPDAPRYVASGEVPGFLLNQFAMDEHDGFLRVASTTSPDGWWWSDESESLVTVLGVSGNRLEPVGQVAGLGEGERIFAVRFLGDTGYVVTFRQTDPLYTIDLSDPTAPRATGELKILGYSAYLHPLGEGRILGLGQDADEDGRVEGTQLSLFDVADPANPTRLAQVTMEGGWSQIESDHHAFTLSGGLALAPYERWDWQPVGENGDGKSEFDTGVLAVRVDGDNLRFEGILRPVADGPVGDDVIQGGQPWLTVPIRTTVIDGRVYTITTGGIAVHDADTLGRIGYERF